MLATAAAGDLMWPQALLCGLPEQSRSEQSQRAARQSCCAGNLFHIILNGSWLGSRGPPFSGHDLAAGKIKGPEWGGLPILMLHLSRNLGIFTLFLQSLNSCGRPRPPTKKPWSGTQAAPGDGRFTGSSSFVCVCVCGLSMSERVVVVVEGILEGREELICFLFFFVQRRGFALRRSFSPFKSLSLSLLISQPLTSLLSPTGEQGSN